MAARRKKVKKKVVCVPRDSSVYSGNASQQVGELSAKRDKALITVLSVRQITNDWFAWLCTEWGIVFRRAGIVDCGGEDGERAQGCRDFHRKKCAKWDRQLPQTVLSRSSASSRFDGGWSGWWQLLFSKRETIAFLFGSRDSFNLAGFCAPIFCRNELQS
ncbi:hypothetical protein AVEN_46772-1 [Araneus ventricosus]|uniref:Uncharacterized protein n=1 Tax=Araneus ventricosus TaxID=182803 RepID=A0A4Y2ARD6_ARAVE|nr:hypothetical protein AVEN_46772-1 [Araneus ventricosus]